MAGNVWEWMSGNYDPLSYNLRDDQPNSLSIVTRLVRGGSWSYAALFARAAFRRGVGWGIGESDAASSFGFRLART